MIRLSPEDAGAALEASGVFAATAPFGGRFIGSIPLDLHGEAADADIVCQADNLDAFMSAMTSVFGDAPDFHGEVAPYLGRPPAIARFTLPCSARPLPVEIFARPEPIEAHESYRHHQAALRLLELGGQRLRDQVRNLKALGFKTEPAFAQALSLEGDPFFAMLDLAEAPTFVLVALVASWDDAA